MVKKSCH